MQTTFSSGLVWLRRDLRVTDHAALYHALKHCQKVHVVFVFDTAILDKLPRADRRVEFIRDSLVQVDERLRALAGHPQAGLIVRHGVAQDKIAKLAHHLQVQAVFANHDDEPQALARDIQVRGHLADHGIVLHTFKDHVIFERNEVLTQVGKPFAVFTPYKNAWLKKITPFDLKAYPVEKYAQHLAPRPDDLAQPVPALQDIDFENTNLHALKIPPGESGGQTLLQDFLTRIDHYEDTRNFPAVKGPSYLSVHLRFGTVSIRQLAREAHARLLAGSPGAAVWLSELIWRDFYVQVLHNFSHVGRGQSFKPEYDSIKWEHGTHAQAWRARPCRRGAGADAHLAEGFRVEVVAADAEAVQGIAVRLGRRVRQRDAVQLQADAVAFDAADVEAGVAGAVPDIAGADAGRRHADQRLVARHIGHVGGGAPGHLAAADDGGGTALGRRFVTLGGDQDFVQLGGLRKHRRGGQGESGQQQRGKAPLARKDGSHGIPGKVRLKLALPTGFAGNSAS
eukprot:gene17329-19750_t